MELSARGLSIMAPEPWRKHRVIETIAAFDIVIATFSIFHNGKTILTVFGGLHNIGQEENWAFIFLIFFFTFGIQILQILFAMYLLKGSRKGSSSMGEAIKISKIWIVSSIIFLILAILELGIGLTSFEYNNYTALFIVFGIGKLIWRIFTIYFVICFIQDLQVGLGMTISSGQDSACRENLLPVFKMIVTNPDNCHLDITNNVNTVEEQWSA